MLKRCIVAAAAAAVLATAPAQAYEPLESDPEVINFGLINTEGTQSLKQQWTPLIKDMEEALGMEVNAFFAPDYAGIIEGMRFGKVQVAWLGNKAAMEAVDRAGAEIFVQTTKTDGSRGYYSYMLAAADSGLESIDDLLKCDGTVDFGYGDPNSTSGYLVPGYYVFAKNGVDPNECFATVRNASHSANVMAVANGLVDAATNNNETFGRMKSKNPALADKVKVIWKSPMIPSDPIVYREDLSAQLKGRIKAFFMAYGRLGPDAEAQRKVLAAISDGLGPFVDSDNRQLYPIRELSLFKERTELKNNANIGATERQERLSEIDMRLDRLSTLSAGLE